VDTRVDPKNCGGCGQSCDPGKACEDGSCVVTCSAGASLCQGGCVDVTADPAHCGGCKLACPQGMLCSQGKCSHECFGGASACDGKCVDTHVNAKHCGGCNAPCASGQTCLKGKCVAACVGGLSECSGKCVDVDAEPAHCGGCDKACLVAQKCDSGLCCDAGKSNCKNACVDTAINSKHCGGCDKACGAEEICAAGSCSYKTSCLTLLKSDPTLSDGSYILDPDGPGGAAPFSAFCDMTTQGGGWTLVARFSNQDASNWMLDNGSWWYDKTSEAGTVGSPFVRGDMIGQGFWRVPASEMRVSRSDYPMGHTLMRTTGNCLGGKTFRAFITGFGDFKNGVVWGKDSVKGSCNASYSGYEKTFGFELVGKDGKIGGPDKVSFWSDWGGAEFKGNGAVIMFGSGGDVGGAAHGIGVTESDGASFATQFAGMGENDLGSSGAPQDLFLNDPGFDLDLYVL
jgi:hypothetical protein